TATAATLFWLDEGIDSGPILLQELIDVAPYETARTLYVKHTETLARLLPAALDLIEIGNAPRIAQDHANASYCAKRVPEDGRIDWREPAQSVLRLIRAVSDPYPGAFTTYGDRRLIVDAAAWFPES